MSEPGGRARVDGPVDREVWRRVEHVLDLALATDPSEWPTLLDDTCGRDTELRQQVEALLERLPTAQRYLETPPAQLAAALLAEEQGTPGAEHHAGRRIGAYRLQREIGRGGMARVFLATRADGEFEQHVAIKLLRPGNDSPLDQERFRTERRILASLNHPNIARLLDGGVTDDGQPYLVMEHVAGQPIDAFVEARGLALRERLALFLAVCDATQYAHQQLVVHRDLKPSNILVDERGAPKLLDFGLARLLASDDPARAAPVTRTGQRWMTPEYAAPEQVRGDAVTTLTDVYQLGAVLYHLLAGRPPFAREGRGEHGLEHAVLHDDPPAPSTVARAHAGAAVPADLDAIALRALRKEPERRYGSVQALADDVRRHLTGNPVLARRQTTAYRARRFIRRHRLGVTAGSAIAVLLIAYAATVTLQRARIRVALAEARVGTQRAEQVTDLMMGLFVAAEGGRALTDTLTARSLLNRGLERARELRGEPYLQAQMLDVIGRLYTQLGDHERARPLVEEALALRRTLHGDDHPDVVTSLESLAAVADGRRDIADAVRLRREVLAARRRISGDDDARTIDALFELSVALHRATERAEGDSLLDVWMRAVARQPLHRTAARARQLTSAAGVLKFRGEKDRAETLYRDALAIRSALFGESHHLVASSLLDLGTLYDEMGRYEEAEPLLQQAVVLLRASYPDGHPDLADAVRGLAMMLEHVRRFDEAEPLLREALAMRRRMVGPNTVDVAVMEIDLSYALAMTGRYSEAEDVSRNAIRILRAQLGDDNGMVVYAGKGLGEALRGQGRYEEAESLIMAAYRRFETPRPATTYWRRAALGGLVRLYEAQGRTEEAAKYRALLDVPPPRSTPSAHSPLPPPPAAAVPTVSRP